MPKPIGQDFARPWFRLHASAYVVMLLAAAVLFFLNVPGERTTEFALYPYEPWVEPVQKEEGVNLIVSGNRNLISTRQMLVHGWPSIWLVRNDVFGHADADIHEPRDTKVWSFSEDALRMYPAWLALDVVIALALIAAAGVLFERWRRKRRHIWQQTIWDWLVLIAIVGAGTAFALKTARDYREERAGLSAMGRLTDDELTQSLFEGMGYSARTSGGPSWLKEVLGDSWPAWFERTVQLDIGAEHLEQLARFPMLRALRVEDVRLDDEQLSVLSSLKRLELLRLERVYPSSLTKNDDGPNDDKSVARLVSYLDGLNRLEVLWLDSFALGDESARAASAIPMLRILVVNSARGLTDDGLSALARCQRLEVMDLGDNEISDGGIRRLASLVHLRVLKVGRVAEGALDELKALPALEELRCSGRGLSAGDIKRFAELPRLRRLTLEGTWEFDAVEQLEAMRPDVWVTVEYVPRVKRKGME